MNKLQTFQQFIATQSPQISMAAFVLDFFLTALLSFLLSRLYISYGTSLSNRKMFANNFILISLTTMLVISIVKSSLALSLGMVGALSIVRFRAAIKEPEELAYLFLSIAIGLGFGANQRLITASAFLLIAATLVLRRKRIELDRGQTIYITLTSSHPKKIDLIQIVDILRRNCSLVDLKRFDETAEVVEASFVVELENLGSIQKTKAALHQLDENIKITFLDHKGNI